MAHATVIYFGDRAQPSVTGLPLDRALQALRVERLPYVIHDGRNGEGIRAAAALELERRRVRAGHYRAVLTALQRGQVP